MKNALVVLLLSLISSLSFAESAAEGGGNPILDPTAMDTSVDPCQDFYQFSCGNWIKRTSIPSDQSDWARSFSVVFDQNLVTLNDVLTDYSKGKSQAKTPYAKKLGDYYASCMDENQVEKDSRLALASQLNQISKLKDKGQLPGLVAKLHLEGVSAFFGFTAAADLKNPALEIAEIDQGGMGLPDSTYYTKTDDDSVKLRQQYQDHIAKMLNLAGYKQNDAKKAASAILSLETELGRTALPPENLQDPTKIYHPGDFKSLQRQTPHFQWQNYFRSMGIRNPQIIDVTEPEFVSKVNAIVQETALSTLQDYLKWLLIESLAPSLGKDLYSEWFHFEGATLKGRKSPPPRWKTCVRAVSGGLSEALGQAFVEKTFSSRAKERAIALIAHLRQAFQQDLQSLIWLDDQTRTAALAKLDLLTQKIGYPDKWRNYDGLKIKRNSYSENNLQSRIFENRRVVGKIGGPVDPLEWGMSPQTVNAYYDPSVNQINFPAGILQPPFFSEQANDAANFGAIGMVIGHEMTHGFDTSGSQFDGHGAEKDWWSPAVKALFEKKAQCLEDQYGQYAALPGMNVNGKLTITENIADQGGLKLAFAAFKLAMAKGNSQTLPADSIAGLNENQQFFVSMAQMWCEKQTDEALRVQISTDPHSPARFRVIGTVVNNSDFAAAFSCSPNAPMAPTHRCEIW